MIVDTATARQRPETSQNTMSMRPRGERDERQRSSTRWRYTSNSTRSTFVFLPFDVHTKVQDEVPTCKDEATASKRKPTWSVTLLVVVLNGWGSFLLRKNSTK